jgi:hypothetical protein
LPDKARLIKQVEEVAAQVALALDKNNQALLEGWEAMPEVAQWVGAALPLTYFLKILRGILLRGVGLEALWKEAAVLVGFATVLIAMSVARFRKSVE